MSNWNANKVSGDKLYGYEWNNLASYGLTKPASYIIDKSGDTYRALNGSTGKIDFSGTDASTVINNSLGALTSGRTWKERVVVKGEIVIYNTISIPSYTVLDLQGAKLILGNNVNKTMLSIGGHHIEILGGILYGNKTNNTSGDVIVSSGSYLDILVAGTKIFEVKGTGISFVYSSYVTITDCEVSGGYYGILLMNVDNALVEGNYIHDTDTASGIVVQESSSGGSNNIRIQGNYVYNAKTIGILARGSATYPSIRISIIGNITTNNKNDGICVAGVESSSIVGNISFQNTFDGISIQVAINSVLEGNVSYQNGGNGIYICDECTNLLVQGNMLFNNDTDLSNDDGIRLSLFSSSVCPTGIKILNNVCTDTRPSGSKTQCYGINIFSGSDYNVVEGNYVNGNRTGSLYNGGAGSIIKNNIGYTTENSGTATFSGTGAQTTFTIPHGCSSTPTYCEIGAKSTDAKGDKYWSVDQTNITVTFGTAPPAGTNNVVLSWKAEV
jgi:parallel beta-helix repeat protein